MQAKYFKHQLQFKKPARTSRGEMQTHTAWIVSLKKNNKTAYGEASPLPGLSVDDCSNFETQLQNCCHLVNDGLPADMLPIDDLPSLRFAFEAAQLGLLNNAPFCYGKNPFYKGLPIAINGLVWMDDAEAMLNQAVEKIESGFNCIKFKVGALDFDEECRMLEKFRKRFNAFTCEIRLDANGAFSKDDVSEKLQDLSRFEIHSIEQPVKPGQAELLEELVKKTQIPIALDEELIGLSHEAGEKLLNKIRPHYLILKPTLIGGLRAADEWINIARKMQIGWWATSALESAIGLNIIAQWVSAKNNPMPQGLGTGGLFTNNFASPLVVSEGKLHYSQTGNGQEWLIR